MLCPGPDGPISSTLTHSGNRSGHQTTCCNPTPRINLAVSYFCEPIHVGIMWNCLCISRHPPLCRTSTQATSSSLNRPPLCRTLNYFSNGQAPLDSLDWEQWGIIWYRNWYYSRTKNLLLTPEQVEQSCGQLNESIEPLSKVRCLRYQRRIYESSHSETQEGAPSGANTKMLMYVLLPIATSPSLHPLLPSFFPRSRAYLTKIELPAPAEVATNASYIITMVPTSQHVHDVYLGKDGVMRALEKMNQESRSQTLCLDQSTIEQSVSKAVALKMREVDADMMDAPVSGGTHLSVHHQNRPLLTCLA
jgi:hypothetical protein